MSDPLTSLNGTPASALGLGGNDQTSSRLVDRAVRGGINYLFFYSPQFDGMVDGIARACVRTRDRLVLATGTEDRSPPAIEAYVEDIRQRFDIDQIDLFYAEYISPGEDSDTIFGANGALATIESLVDKGIVRAVGATVHDRDLAIELIESGRIQVLMHRYNVAHRKSEQAVLPCAAEHGVPVVAFTCTRWGSLLRGHPEWGGAVPDAAACYRYALAHPSVRLALTSPRTVWELDENLEVLDTPESVADVEALRAYGDLVYGDGMDAFETRWP